MTPLSRRSLLGLAATFSAFGSGPAFAAAIPVVAAASDLNAALPEVISSFTRATGNSVRPVYGSSGNFTQQILNGAPFEVFLSADEAYVDQLAAARKTDGRGALYGIGRIGLFAPTGSPIRCDGRMSDLAPAIRDGRLLRFAIANPEHAPYGRAAQQALTHVGVWPSILPRLVLGENAAQATQFATSGSAQAGIIPYSLGLTAPVQAAGVFALISASWHRPLRQRAVAIRGAGPQAQAFLAYLQSPQARAIFRRYGFALPGDRA